MALVKQTSTISASAIFFTAVFYGSTWGHKNGLSYVPSAAPYPRQAPDCPSDSQTPPDHCADPGTPGDYVRLFAHGYICSCHRLLRRSPRIR